MWMIGAGGFLLPVALVFTSVFISRELNASAKVPGLDSSVPAATASDREARGGPGSSDDRSDRCSEPEHAADPTCSSGTSGTGGGSSSGGDGQSSTSGSSSEPSPTASPTREDNSGPGSSSSGSGSDGSGSGSGGGDNSGPGGDD